MKKIAIIILSFCMLLSCKYERGSGNIISRTKDTAPFTSVNIAGGFTVEIRNGPTKVVAEADDNLINYIEINVVNNELKVRLKDISSSNGHFKIFITAPAVNSLEASAGASIRVKDELKSGTTINISASSGSNITTALDAPEVKAEVSSGAEVNLSGHTKDFRVTASSGSSIVASELLSENSYATASSGSHIKVNASMRVDGNASSGSNISYSGTAPEVRKSESSGGEVEKNN